DHAASERRMTLHLVPLRSPQRDAVIQRRVIADLGGLADDNAHAVVDEHPSTDRRAGVDLDAGEPATPMREPPSQPLETGSPQAMCDGPVPDQSVQAGIASEPFPRAPRGRVPVENHPDVFPQTIEHEAILAFPSNLLN